MYVLWKSFTAQGSQPNTTPIGKNKNKDYTCTDCGAEFKIQTKFFEHLKLVHGKGAFSCSYCDQTFTQSSGLMRHVKSLHEGLRFSCNICEKNFTQKSHLNRHLNLNHNMKEQKISVENLEKEMAKTHKGVKVSLGTLWKNDTKSEKYLDKRNCVYE